MTRRQGRNQDRKQEGETQTGKRRRPEEPSPPLVSHDPNGAEVVGPVACAQLPIDVGAPGVELPLVGKRQAVAVARHHLIGNKRYFTFNSPSGHDWGM